jgi:N-acetylneuraminic acid mutarotase
MKKLLIFLFLFELTTPAFAQSIGINNTGASPHVSAILDIQSTDKGLLIPRMTQAQRHAIAGPATGLMVYQTDQEKGFYYNYSTPIFPLWKKVGADALPKGMIVISDSFPNSVLESNGFSPAGALQNGGVYSFGDYGRWTPTNTDNRLQLTTTGVGVWTGTEALYWSSTDAKRYNPSTDTWTTIPPTATLTPRTNPACTWTGTEMVIWGGRIDANTVTNTGARFNPSTNTWQPMSPLNAPAGVENPFAFWTGSEIIFFGGSTGFEVAKGAKYNPATNIWTTIPDANGPGQFRKDYAIAWTGSKMIVWGGRLEQESQEDGFIYDPVTNNWSSMPIANAPAARHNAEYIWTGTELLIWGGESVSYNVNCQCYYPVNRTDGAKFNPSTMTWSPITAAGAPVSMEAYKTAFAGGRWCLFNKEFSRSYNPSTNTWTTIPNPGVLLGEYVPYVVKSIGDKIIVWGSADAIVNPSYAQCHPVGGIWDPAGNTWEKNIVSIDAPLRNHMTPIWTGTELIINTMPLPGDPQNAVVSSKYNPSLQGFGNAMPKTLYLYKKN